MGVRRALRLLAPVLALATATFLSTAPRASAQSESASTGAGALGLGASAEALQPLGIDADRLAYHARVETGATVALVSDAVDLRAFVDPTTDGSGVAITLVDRAATRSDSRVVALADVPRGDRARVVAIALGEMVRARRAAVPPPATSPAAPAAPPGSPAASSSSAPAAAAEAPPPAAVSPPAMAIEAMGGGAWFSQRNSALVDLRLGGERRLALPLWARAELGLGLGGASDRAGDVALVLPSIALGVRLRADVSRSLVLGAGPMLDAGVAFASGAASTGARGLTAEALTVRAAIEADGRLRVADSVYFVLGLGVGVMLRGAELHADDRVPLAAAGLALGARAGVGIALP